jgi:hypothetical protein
VLEKFKKITNPLTIIAIFAGIAEVMGTIALPFVSDTNQSIFIWFLIVFPTLLVCLFFLTLNFNHKVLYSPSDYREDSSFLAAANIKNSEISVSTESRSQIKGITFNTINDVPGERQE